MPRKPIGVLPDDAGDYGDTYKAPKSSGGSMYDPRGYGKGPGPQAPKAPAKDIVLDDSKSTKERQDAMRARVKESDDAVAQMLRDMGGTPTSRKGKAVATETTFSDYGESKTVPKKSPSASGATGRTSMASPSYRTGSGATSGASKPTSSLPVGTSRGGGKGGGPGEGTRTGRGKTGPQAALGLDWKKAFGVGKKPAPSKSSNPTTMGSKAPVVPKSPTTPSKPNPVAGAGTPPTKRGMQLDKFTKPAAPPPTGPSLRSAPNKGIGLKTPSQAAVDNRASREAAAEAKDIYDNRNSPFWKLPKFPDMSLSAIDRRLTPQVTQIPAPKKNKKKKSK